MKRVRLLAGVSSIEGSFAALSEQTISDTLSDELSDAGLAEVVGPARGGVRGRPVISVAAATHPWPDRCDYRCNGADDHIQIQAALDEAGDDAEVWIGGGDFILGGTIAVTAKYPRLVGDNWSTRLVIPSGGNFYAITFARPGNLDIGAYFAHFGVEGNAAGQTGGGGIDASRAIHSHFERIHFEHCHTAGLYLHDGTGGVAGHHNRVTSCLFDNNNTSPGNGYGLWMVASDENFVSRNDFEGNGGAIGSRSAIRDESGLQMIVANSFVNGEEGVRVQDAAGTIISSNIFDSTKREAVVVTGEGAMIQANRFFGIGWGSPGAYRCVLLDGGTGGHSIIGNSFRAHEVDGTTRRFIQENTPSNYTLVTGNILRGVDLLQQVGADAAIFLGGANSIKTGNIEIA